MKWDVTDTMQAAVAIGTLSLAGVTAFMAKRTHEVASKTQGLVEASSREALATESLASEARTDRQLAWRPQLELVGYQHVGETFVFDVRNTGAGPALQVACLSREIENIGRWCLLRLGDLRPGEQKRQGVAVRVGSSLTSPFEGIPGMVDGVEVVEVVIVCGDVLDRRFRFGHSRLVSLPPEATGRKPLPADISTVTEDHPNHVGWAAEPMIWG
jgi:hypothetical protein